MPLSTAERQKRFIQKLKDRSTGVTPDMIRQAARLQYESYVANEDGAEPWQAFLARCRRHRDRASPWTENLTEPPNRDYSEFGEDEEMMRRVAQIVDAVLRPPAPKV